MGLSKTKYKCSKCDRVYDYHPTAVYIDTQSSTLVMKCPVDGAVAYWYDGEISSYEVVGASDLMEVEVDNERKTLIFKMSHDTTKQNTLTVKTDTPETVDISLEKDVLQVDVANTNGGEKQEYETVILPITNLSMSDSEKVEKIHYFPSSHIKITSYVGDDKMNVNKAITSVDIDLYLSRTNFAYLNHENPIQIGFYGHDYIHQVIYEKLGINGMEFEGMFPAITLYYEIIDYKKPEQVQERKEFTYPAELSMFPNHEPLDDETIPLSITVREDFIKHLYSFESDNVIVRITGFSTYFIIE